MRFYDGEFLFQRHVHRGRVPIPKLMPASNAIQLGIKNLLSYDNSHSQRLSTGPLRSYSSSHSRDYPAMCAEMAQPMKRYPPCSTVDADEMLIMAFKTTAKCFKESKAFREEEAAGTLKVLANLRENANTSHFDDPLDILDFQYSLWSHEQWVRWKGTFNIFWHIGSLMISVHLTSPRTCCGRKQSGRRRGWHRCY